MAGNGAPVAVLNLYSRDSAAMAPVSERVWNVSNPGSVQVPWAKAAEPPMVKVPAGAMVRLGHPSVERGTPERGQFAPLLADRFDPGPVLRMP